MNLAPSPGELRPASEEGYQNGPWRPIGPVDAPEPRALRGFLDDPPAPLLKTMLQPLLTALALLPALAGPGPQEGGEAPELDWNERNAEHLLNRAGFGARSEEIQGALRLGPERVVDLLLTGGREVEPPHVVQESTADAMDLSGLPREQRRRVRALRKRDDLAQLLDYESWWVERMVRHDDPLRDRMALFWHGLFATNYKTVKRSYDLIQQHRLLRENALGSYGDLLQGIVRDPAMIKFLDNDRNKKGAPNENLARELMELFSLGEGHYTEADVREVARALTGESRDSLGNYVYKKKNHDRGEKTVLGETGRFGADEVVEILLRQTACSRYISRRLIAYLEGIEPDKLRVAEYAAFLEEQEYELRPFLRKLLLDPRFYREEVVAARIASPIDYYVGLTRRLAMKLEPRVILAAAATLDQDLFDPPSVKGWDEGLAWITTGSLLQRGNTTGLLLGTVDLEEVFLIKAARDPLAEPAPERESSMEEAAEELPEEAEDGMGGMGGAAMGDEGMGAMASADEGPVRDELPRELRAVVRALGDDYRPRVNLCHRMRVQGQTTDGEIVDRLMGELLAIPPPADTRARVLYHFTAERERAELPEVDFLADTDRAEPVLRRLAHLILSLPEAQLH